MYNCIIALYLFSPLLKLLFIMPKRPLTDMIHAFSAHQEELIRNAAKHKQEVISQSLENLREVIDDPLEHPYKGYVSDSLVLLAYMEEERAHPLLMKLTRLPEQQVEDLIGVTMPNQLPAFLYKTAGNSIAAIQKLIKDSSAYLYCRTAAIKALIFAAEDGVVTRKEALDFLVSLYTGKEANEADSCFWDDITEAVCDLKPEPQHFKAVKQAIKAGLTSLKYIDEQYVPMLR